MDHIRSLRLDTPLSMFTFCDGPPCARLRSGITTSGVVAFLEEAMFWNIRICSRCGRALPEDIEHFAASKDSKSGLTARCRECCSEVMHARYMKNRDVALKKCALYRRAHAEQIKVYLKAWGLANKEYVAAWRVARRVTDNPIRAKKQQERYRSDPQFRERIKLRRRLDHALRGTSANSPVTAEIIGCTTAQLHEHLERLFSPGMTWANRGKGKVGWQVDHIKPCCCFDLTVQEQRKACFNYTNLRPVWAVDNLKKGTKCE